ncbi:MAG: hypothetical protein KGI50_08025 [Patescibacteria group bacterium]|nr:hypothetical protein [Patescibacteria group bacterium]MDE1941381.1 hypothetical protein [Patescibacteria group bacterium]MDE1971493.1 hypothetical protein [Patescibacteria group bacterium]
MSLKIGIELGVIADIMMRKMPINWTKIYKKYKGFWVALADDESTVLASGKSLKETVEKARKMGFNDPIMTRVPENISSFVGLS